MPTYEYECAGCRHAFERFQSMTEPRLKKCPACGGRVKRLLGAGSGIIFKGSGFYATDYRGKSPASNTMKKEKCPAAATCGAACGASGN